MIGDVWLSSAVDDGYVQLYASGDAAEGAFRCAECGYGVAVSAALPPCPMCAGRSWERASQRRG